MEKLPQIVRILLGGLAIVVSAVLSWILEYFIGNIAMLTVVLGGIVFVVLNPELMSGQSAKLQKRRALSVALSPWMWYDIQTPRKGMVWMVTFECPQFEDRQWVQPLLEAEGSLGCEYNFANIYLWSRAYPQKIARWGDRLLVQIQGSLGLCYLYPAGRGPLAPAVDALAGHAAVQGIPLTLVCVTGEQRAALEDACPGRFSFEEDRGGFDYLYDINRLADLPGKKLHAKRNHIRRFDEQFPDWLLEDITPANVPQCVELERRWAAIRQEAADGDTVSEETVAVMEALYHMDKLGLEGALIRADGDPIAFSLGGFITPECFDVNFEKSFGDIQGAYPAINRELARLIRSRHPGVKWLNREDDMGLEGLRRAKLSYYPDRLLTKYTAKEVGA